jgi:hypothetical protein
MPTSKIINGVDLKLPILIDPPIYSKIGEEPNKMIVACVWWGTKYGRNYVENLRNSLKRNLSIPYEMVCITDRDDLPDGIRKIPALKNGDGWWQKVNLFKPGMFPSDTRILFLDLDVVITSSLDPISRSQGEFVMIENFSMNRRASAYNSSCMLWTPNEKTERIYTCYNSEVVEALHGDQCWIWRVMEKDILAFRKDLLESYKYNRARPEMRRASNDTAVWVFHGKPDPHEVNAPFVKNNWR